MSVGANRVARALVAALGVAAVAMVPVGSSEAGTQPEAGPSCPFITELINHAPDLGLKGEARITKTECGYRYFSGRQNNRLVITQVGDKLRFSDPRTDRVDRLADACSNVRGVPGIVVLCPIPRGTDADHPLLVEVWPRLGDDFVDGSTLSAMFSMTVLGDAGHDVAFMGAGDDFFNGAFDADQVRGGAGDDWIRSGDQRDRVAGGPGHDYITSGEGGDRVVGGGGADRIYCGPGADDATRDGGDLTVYQCESVSNR